jgi:hypothetical protein
MGIAHLPGFTAELGLKAVPRSKLSGRVSAAGSKYSRHARRREEFHPAARDQNQQNYHDCLVDCRLGGGKDCAKQCSTPSGSGSAGSSTGTSNTPSESGLCVFEEITHPLGTAIMDGIVRAARDNGTITNKSDCYTWADTQAGITGAIAGGIGNVVGGFFGGFFGAAVGFNSYTLSHCVCDRYF